VRLTVPSAKEPRADQSAAAHADSAVHWVLCCGRHEHVLVPSTIVGRGADADIQLDDESVSRRHARLSYVEGSFEIEDLASKNGTRVNGAQVVAPVRLSAGDHVGLGDSDFQLILVSALRRERVTQPLADVASPRKALADSSLAALSPRERTIFPLLARGLSQREIAAECSVTVKTVETYRTRISHKLGLHSRADLIRLALETGVLRPSDRN
jgi:DNA-binding CsgD family transcriptional regulator